MKKAILFVFILLCATTFANNKKKIIVALSLNDCISCSIALTEVNKILKNPEITIVFEEELMSDSILVKKKTGLDNFKSAVPVYSDSLFKEYVNGIKSTINIVENNKKIYASDLYQLNVEDFSKNYLNNEKLCLQNIKSGDVFIQDEKTMLVKNSKLNRWSYYDKNKEFDIIADDSWVKKAYNIYYGKNKTEAKYQKFQDYLKEYSILNPIINNGIKINDKELLFITTIHIIEEIDQKANFLQKTFLTIYSIDNKNIESIKYVNDESLFKNKNYINNLNIHSYNNKYIFTFDVDDYNTSEPINYLAVFKTSPDKKDELIFEKIIENNIPNNYLKYNLHHNFNQSHFDKTLVLLDYGEFIYDFEKNKEYKIPLAQSEFDNINNIFKSLSTGTLNTYGVYDIADKGSSILFLYFDSGKNVKLIEIDKASQKALYERVLMPSEKFALNLFSGFRINDNFEIIYYNKSTKCIEKINY